VFANFSASFLQEKAFLRSSPAGELAERPYAVGHRERMALENLKLRKEKS